MAAEVTVLRRHDPCAWLPPGGVAEVVAYGGPVTPEPTVVVRLLLAAPDGAVLVVPRPDSRGPDLPAATVEGEVVDALAALASEHLSRPSEPRLIGFVRNTVADPPDDYPWPAPMAHFTVWSVEVDAADRRRGTWLAHAEAERQLAERHWWPLLDSVPFALGERHARRGASYDGRA